MHLCKLFEPRFSGFTSIDTRPSDLRSLQHVLLCQRAFELLDDACTGERHRRAGPYERPQQPDVVQL